MIINGQHDHLEWYIMQSGTIRKLLSLSCMSFGLQISYVRLDTVHIPTNLMLLIPRDSKGTRYLFMDLLWQNS